MESYIIREVQADMTNQMISLESKENCVVQLNMGEGKTTLIVPAVCAAEADGTKIVRVIVARANG